MSLRYALRSMSIGSAILIATLLAATSALAQRPEPEGTGWIEDQKKLASIANGPESSAGERKFAYALLMAGQRYVWLANRSRDRVRAIGYLRSAQDSLIAATEADPSVAEAFTLLAEVEISISSRPNSVDQAISWLDRAVIADPNSFGARRLRARLLSSRAGFRRQGDRRFDELIAKKALGDWEAVAEADPRNAEAWAFIGALQERFGNDQKAIDAFRSWTSSSVPIDRQFYSFVMGQNDELTVQNASLKLGAALLRTGSTEDAINTIGSVLTDDPKNQVALAMLEDALSHKDEKTSRSAAEMLYRNTIADPNNYALLEVLGEFYGRKGMLAEAKEIYRRSLDGSTVDPITRARAFASFGGFLLRNRLYSDSAAAFRAALESHGLEGREAETESEREFAIETYTKLIRAKRLDGDIVGAKRAIDDSRQTFGGDDSFADRQLISVLRGTGQRDAALGVARDLKKRFPDDLGLIRLEATLLSDVGRIDEAVSGFLQNMRTLSEKTIASSGRPTHDNFSDQVFIAELYSRAKRGNEAITAAERALNIAASKETRQIAKLTLATAQNTAGDFGAAERTLREILAESPGNPFALNNLGYYLLERNERIEDAKAMIQRAVLVDPMNPSFLDSLGWAYYKLGDYSEAERRLSEAAGFDPESATIQEHLGDAFDKLGKTERAKGAWESALSLATDDEMIRRIKEKLGLKN